MILGGPLNRRIWDIPTVRAISASTRLLGNTIILQLSVISISQHFLVSAMAVGPPMRGEVFGNRPR